MIGESPVFARAIQVLNRFAGCDAPVLIEGETGTGKELAARFVHYRSARRSGPFVPLNCGAVPDALFENELFGHDRGAFTDARSVREGLVGLARGGTLFLDEVDSLSPKGQVALLRFLQDNTYRPLGGAAEQRADLRVIAAANVSLDALCDRGAFRRDLLFRVKLLFLELPPLRARPGDARLLAEHFLEECSRVYGAPARRLGPAAVAWLEAYHWPGNVRELENVVHRAFLLSDGPELSLGDGVGPAAGRGPGGAGYKAARARAIEDFHRRFLGELLEAAHGNLSSAARRSGADRRMLGRLVRRY
ncbi:MAG TPA: sigma 54-interacting transcriptional regulator, partial [Anaeromyxobacter sp.]|nr:sigma 54-interacting transcriptional regulator [Anaeromyxobacter sp.]